MLFSEEVAGSGTIETTHVPNPDAIGVFGDSILYVNLEECTSCTACYQPDVCPVGAIYSEEHLPGFGLISVAPLVVVALWVTTLLVGEAQGAGRR